MFRAFEILETAIPVRRFLAVLILWVSATSAVADPPPVSAAHGLAAEGYDVVAFFEDRSAVKGDRSHALMWRGAIWLFSSEKNRETFEMNPRAYAPRFGGYCALGIARNKLVPGDPDTWEVVDGSLYLTANERVKAIWVEDLSGNITMAEANWPEVLRR